MVTQCESTSCQANHEEIKEKEMTMSTRPSVPAPRRWHTLRDDSGMSTVEYAIGTIAAAAFAAVLYAVISGDSIVGALTSLIQRALTANF